MLMPIGLNRDSNPGHLVGVPIHAQAANPNAELENTAGISDSNGSSWLYKQNMLPSTFYLASLTVALCYLNFIVGAARCFLSVTTSVGMLYQKIHMNSSPIVLPQCPNLLLSARRQFHDRMLFYIQTFLKGFPVVKVESFLEVV